MPETHFLLFSFLISRKIDDDKFQWGDERQQESGKYSEVFVLLDVYFRGKKDKSAAARINGRLHSDLLTNIHARNVPSV